MNSQHKAVSKDQEVMSDKSQDEEGLVFTCVEPPDVCVYARGGLSTRLLKSYSRFRTSHEMLLKNYAVGEFYKTIPALFS